MMGKQTKHVVGLSDLMAVRLECKKCYSILSVTFVEPAEREKKAKVPQLCPGCGETWTTEKQHLDVLVEDFLRSFRKLYGFPPVESMVELEVLIPDMTSK